MQPASRAWLGQAAHLDAQLAENLHGSRDERRRRVAGPDHEDAHDQRRQMNIIMCE
jgi:hypothetical protein